MMRYIGICDIEVWCLILKKFLYGEEVVSIYFLNVTEFNESMS